MNAASTMDHRLSRVSALLALALTAGFFAIAGYISLAEHPARLELDPGPALAHWKPSFTLAFRLQGTLTILASLAALGAWWLGRGRAWLFAGLLMLANWPWTLAMIQPINAALMMTAPDAADRATMALLAKWGELHLVRTAISGMALALILWPRRAQAGRIGA